MTAAIMGRVLPTDRRRRRFHDGRGSLPLTAALLGLSLLAACGGQSTDRRAAAAAARAAEEEKARAEADARRERARLADLWTYTSVPVSGGRQVSATIRSVDDVETDGGAPRPVTLVFRDHPAWGQSSYLLLQAGDFRCAGGCRVTVTVDDAAPRPMAARRPNTDEAIAMFIDDARGLYRLMMTARRMAIAFPVRAGGTREAVFDVAGLDPSKMPAAWTAFAPAK
jgi:hypothetical protein